MTRNFRAGFWRLADPKISLASFAGLFLGACLAATDGPFSWSWFLLTLLGIFCVEVAKNASGEVVDYDSGTDLAITNSERSPFSGGKRVMVDGLLTRRQTWAIAAFFFAAAIACGLIIYLWREPDVLYLGLAGLLLAWGYHGAPLRLSYRGLGEIAVAVAYGPLVVSGCYLVQAGTVTPVTLHTGISLGLLVASFLWINQFPDYRADREAGKRNLVVRLGPGPAARAFVALQILGFSWLVATALVTDAHGLLVGLVGILPAGFAARRLLRSPHDIPALVPAQAATLVSFLLLAVGAGLGSLLAG